MAKSQVIPVANNQPAARAACQPCLAKKIQTPGRHVLLKLSRAVLQLVGVAFLGKVQCHKSAAQTSLWLFELQVVMAKRRHGWVCPYLPQLGGHPIDNDQLGVFGVPPFMDTPTDDYFWLQTLSKLPRPSTEGDDQNQLADNSCEQVSKDDVLCRGGKSENR